MFCPFIKFICIFELFQELTASVRSCSGRAHTRVWQKWRYSAPQAHWWLIKHWFSASTFVVKIATFAKPENGTSDFCLLKDQCYLKNWVVYCQKPFAGPDSIIQYLGNYIHRVAISNQRIQSFENGKVTFGYKDYKCGAKQKSITLEADEFIRRFLQPILPCSFYKIRYFGVLAICNIKSKLTQSVRLIGKAVYFTVLEGLTAVEVWSKVKGHDLLSCPKCKIGKLIIKQALVINLEPG
jgi:hypothetical protein